jgi:hypothetical protein
LPAFVIPRRRIFAARVLGGDQAEVGHQLARRGEASEVTDLGHDRGGRDHRDAAHCL